MPASPLPRWENLSGRIFLLQEGGGSQRYYDAAERIRFKAAIGGVSRLSKWCLGYAGGASDREAVLMHAVANDLAAPNGDFDDEG